MKPYNGIGDTLISLISKETHKNKGEVVNNTSLIDCDSKYVDETEKARKRLSEQNKVICFSSPLSEFQ